MHNLLIGKTYIENYGEMEIKCEDTGIRTVINFKELSFFNNHDDLHSISGSITNSQGV
jgi:hypothetical protein